MEIERKENESVEQKNIIKYKPNKGRTAIMEWLSKKYCICAHHADNQFYYNDQENHLMVKET